MGSCSSTNDKKQKNIKTQTQNKIIENNNNIIENKKDSKKLKASNPLNNIEQHEINQPSIKTIKKININIKNNEDENILNSSFEETTLFKDVLSKISFSNNGEYNIYDANNIKLNERTNLKLKDIFKDSYIELKLKYVGLNIPKDIKNAYIENNKFIGSFILDNQDYLDIVIVDTSTQKTNLFRYSNEECSELKKFNCFSAICNGKNRLFISGGEIQKDPSLNEKNEILKDFYMIDLLNTKDHEIEPIKLKNLIEPRTWHSMIYVPPKYIFIIGGTNSNTVELYDIDNDEISIDSELCEQRNECTLCLVNNIYLYAFSGFILHHTFINSIERCNLRKELREWEYVDFELKNNINFNPSFFGIGYFGDDKLILLAGNEDPDEKNQNYVYTFKNDGKDTLEEYSQLNNDFMNIYREKFYIPINEKNSINIPLITNEIQVLYLDSELGQINKVNYNSNLNDE